MGNLRIENTRVIMNAKRYNELKKLLSVVLKASEHHRIFYDLDPEENAGEFRRELKYVAGKEGIELIIRKPRNSNAMEIKTSGTSAANNRISAADYKNRVLEALAASDRPLKKREIIKLADLSGATWNIRIRELLEEGRVSRSGTRSEAVYTAC